MFPTSLSALVGKQKMSPSDASIKALEEAKKILDTSAQTNRNLFIAFNSVLVTVLILCLSITDEMLLLGSSTIKLPLLNVDLPIWAFATIAPLALVALHFDLLQNLGAHRKKLIDWCKCWFKVYPSPIRAMPICLGSCTRFCLITPGYMPITPNQQRWVRGYCPDCAGYCIAGARTRYW
jgi:hypothetical protein